VSERKGNLKKGGKKKPVGGGGNHERTREGGEFKKHLNRPLVPLRGRDGPALRRSSSKETGGEVIQRGED